MVRRVPFQNPYRFKASIPYAEQEGSNLQAGPSKGETEY